MLLLWSNSWTLAKFLHLSGTAQCTLLLHAWYMYLYIHTDIKCAGCCQLYSCEIASYLSNMIFQAELTGVGIRGADCKWYCPAERESMMQWVITKWAVSSNFVSTYRNLSLGKCLLVESDQHHTLKCLWPHGVCSPSRIVEGKHVAYKVTYIAQHSDPSGVCSP